MFPLFATKSGMAHFLPSLPSDFVGRSPLRRTKSEALAKEGQVQILLSITRVAPAPLLQIKSGGTNLIGATNLSPVTKLVTGTGAVWRYKLSRSQKFVKVQDLNCVQMSALTAVASAKAGVRVLRPLRICLGCRGKSKKCDDLSRFFDKKAGNNLPILSVLANVIIFNRPF